MRGPEEWPSSPGSPGWTEFGLQVRLLILFNCGTGCGGRGLRTLPENMFAEPQSHALISFLVETVKNACEILAILVGSAWTYLNYFRGRTYKPRLECSVETSIEKHTGRSFLHVATKVRNIGSSRIPIEPKGTALLIYSVTMQGPIASFPTQVKWADPVAAFDVFSGKKWVESSETITESFMVALPRGGAVTHKITLKVVSGKIWWTAENIVADIG
jgi:hypothetical protein